VRGRRSATLTIAHAAANGPRTRAVGQDEAHGLGGLAELLRVWHVDEA
jgi:hypothetical protein